MKTELFKIPKTPLYVLYIGNLRHDVWTSNGKLHICGGEKELIQQICNFSNAGKIGLKAQAETMVNEYLLARTKSF